MIIISIIININIIVIIVKNTINFHVVTVDTYIYLSLNDLDVSDIFKLLIAADGIGGLFATESDADWME